MKKMSNILDNKIFILVLSFLCAFALWFYVNGVYDTADTRDYKGIPVAVNFEGSIPQQNNLTILSAQDTTVDIKVAGSRVTLSALGKEDIVARVNLDSVTAAGEYDLPVIVNVPGTGLTVSEQSVGTVRIAFDRLERKQVEVKIMTEGAVADGYMLADVTASPSAMTVEGPAEIINKVENILVEADVTGLTAVKTVRSDIVYTDASGAKLDGKYLKPELDSVSVNIPVYFIKEVPLVVTPVNKSGGTDSSMLRYEADPATVRIAGPEADLELLNQISIDVIDTSAIERSETLVYDMPVPNGVKVLDGVTSVTVKISIEDSVTRRFSASNIEITNLAEGLRAKVAESTVSVRVRGLSADIAALSTADILATVDMSNVTATGGTVTVPVTFSFIAGQSVGVVGKYTVTVSLE